MTSETAHLGEARRSDSFELPPVEKSSLTCISGVLGARSNPLCFKQESTGRSRTVNSLKTITEALRLFAWLLMPEAAGYTVPAVQSPVADRNPKVRIFRTGATDGELEDYWIAWRSL